MPTFEIPDGPTSIDIARPGDPKSTAPATGSAVFNVTNKATEGRDGRLSVQVAGSSKAEWFSIDGDRERPFAAGETQTATIKISIPADVAAGDYPFRLRAVAVNDPDNDHAEGPVTTAKLAGVGGKSGGVPWWVWLIIGIVVLAALGAGGYFLLRDKGDGGDNVVEEVTNNVATPATPPPPPPSPTTVAVPNFVGKTVEQAKAEAQGFNVVEAAGTPSGGAPRTILSQLPAADSQQARGAVVQVTFDPGVTVPSVANQNVAQAVQTLQNVSLHVERSTSRCEADGTPDQIVDQDPKPNATVAKGSGVNIVVRTVGGRFGNMKVRCGRAIPFDQLMIRQDDSVVAHRFRAPGQ